MVAVLRSVQLQNSHDAKAQARGSFQIQIAKNALIASAHGLRASQFVANS